jgi:DNA invertase Pin-like site-specific DNA recombinase
VTDQQIVWGAYARLSRLKTSRRRQAPQRGRYRSPDESVQRQLRLIREYADGHGLILDEDLIFPENGRSAWRPPGGPPPVRPMWDDMIAAGKAGRFGGLLTWKLERFSRNIRDGEDLLDLGLLLDGPDSGRIDLRTAHGRSIFRKQIEAADHASGQASERILAVFEDMREHGYRVGGTRLFGFEVLGEVELPGGGGYPEDDGEEDGEGPVFFGPAAVVREEEAEVVRELARRLLDGETMTALAADLNDRGVVTSTKGRWATRNLARMLGNPLYGGRLAYKGEILTTKAGDPVMLANTEPILDSETFERVQAKLAARKRGRRATGLYPLTGIAVCGNPECGRRGTMAGHVRSRGHREYVRVRAYICAKPNGGCGQSIMAEPVEEMVREAVVRASHDADAQDAMREADRFLDERRAKLTRELEDLDDDAARIEAKQQQTPRSMTRLHAQYDRHLATTIARHEATERELAALGTVRALGEPLPPMSAETWKDTPPTEQAVYIRQLGLRITIMPSERKPGLSRLPFEATRVRIDE